MEALGIDLKILLPQIVNFLILFFVLKWLLYKPILKILDDRKKKIDESMALAEKTRKQSEALDTEIKTKIENAKKEALGILAEAKKQGEITKKEIVDKAQKEAEFLMKKAEERIKEQKQEMLKELRHETVNLTIATAEKIIKKKINSQEQENLIAQTINKLK